MAATASPPSQSERLAQFFAGFRDRQLVPLFAYRAVLLFTAWAGTLAFVTQVGLGPNLQANGAIVYYACLMGCAFLGGLSLETRSHIAERLGQVLIPFATLGAGLALPLGGDWRQVATFAVLLGLHSAAVFTLGAGFSVYSLQSTAGRRITRFERCLLAALMIGGVMSLAVPMML